MQTITCIPANMSQYFMHQNETEALTPETVFMSANLNPIVTNTIKLFNVIANY
jgi:hypothetical protein